MVTRAKRANNNKWDAANMTVLGCKVKREYADAFRNACRKSGTTPNEVFKNAIQSFMEEYGTDKERSGL